MLLFLKQYSQYSNHSCRHMQPRLNGGMETLAKRLKYARQRAGMTQKQLADASGMGQGDVSKMENGGILRTTNIVSLARALGCDPVWLETGEGGPEGASNVEPGPKVLGKVPLISWVQAGAWAGAQDLLAPGDAEAWLAYPGNGKHGAFALRVRGDSMTAAVGSGRTYPEGSIIFVDPERRMPMNGERIIAKLSGTDEVTFKVYKNEDGRQWLQPLNPTHEPIRDEFKVLGTVFGKWEPE